MFAMRPLRIPPLLLLGAAVLAPATAMAAGVAPDTLAATDRTATEAPANPAGQADWSASRGSLQLNFNRDLLGDLGLGITPVGAREVDGRGGFTLALEASDALHFQVRGGESVERFTGGRWVARGGFEISHGDRRLELANLTLRPAGAAHVLDIHNGDGEHWFFVDHMHVMADRAQGRITLLNMDLRMTAAFAELIGEPRHAGMSLAVANIEADLHVPADFELVPEAIEGGLSCTGRPLWPSESVPADVALIALPQIQQMRRNAGTGEVVIAPSATLKNVGEADVPWYAQFTAPRPPYNNDQHPFLAYAVFRIHDGRVEQIGRSGLKHAFLTININCTINCGGGGSILWPGCEDIYSTGNNDSPTHMGPLEELDAFRGVWDSCNSFFDPGCTGSQTNYAGPGGGPSFCSSSNNDPGCFINRMVVAEADLQAASFPGAQYLFQGWYLVRDDVNIFNTMGYRPISPAFSGATWSFAPGAFQQGPAVDEFIPEGGSAPGQRNTGVVTDEGHLRVLVNVVDLPGDRYRYEYAVMNLDVGAGVEAFAVPVAAGSDVDAIDFRPSAGVTGGNWPGVEAAGEVRWQAPTPADRQPWISLYNFSFESDQPPSDGQLRVDVVGLGEVWVDSLTPFGDVIFAHDFELP